MRLLRLRRSTALGCLGLAVILWNVGGGIWNAATATRKSVTHICRAAHYGIKGCSQSDHTMNPPQAGRAYIVTDVQGANIGVDQYRVVQEYVNGSTFEVANKSTNVTVPHYVIALSDLWNSQGAKIRPGAYTIYTDYSNGNSVPYTLTITQPPKPPKPPQPPTSTPTSTSAATPTSTGH